MQFLIGAVVYAVWLNRYLQSIVDVLESIALVWLVRNIKETAFVCGLEQDIVTGIRVVCNSLFPYNIIASLSIMLLSIVFIFRFHCDKFLLERIRSECHRLAAVEVANGKFCFCSGCFILRSIFPFIVVGDRRIRRYSIIIIVLIAFELQIGIVGIDHGVDFCCAQYFCSCYYRLDGQPIVLSIRVIYRFTFQIVSCILFGVFYRNNIVSTPTVCLFQSGQNMCIL